jgi:hypothetical protein
MLVGSAASTLLSAVNSSSWRPRPRSAVARLSQRPGSSGRASSAFCSTSRPPAESPPSSLRLPISFSTSGWSGASDSAWRTRRSPSLARPAAWAWAAAPIRSRTRWSSEMAMTRLRSDLGLGIGASLQCAALHAAYFSDVSAAGAGFAMSGRRRAPNFGRGLRTEIGGRSGSAGERSARLPPRVRDSVSRRANRGSLRCPIMSAAPTRPLPTHR